MQFIVTVWFLYQDVLVQMLFPEYFCLSPEIYIVSLIGGFDAMKRSNFKYVGVSK